MSLRIAAFEGFYGGSHRRWLDGLARHSRHEIRMFSLPDRYWKWRMHGGAITLAREFLESGYPADVILATDMIDLNICLGMTRKLTSDIPVALYMHENQLTYPWSETDPDIAFERNYHYSFINYASALAADRVFFNSRYHETSFHDALRPFLKMYPDFQNLQTVDEIVSKSRVLPLALDLQNLDLPDLVVKAQTPVILWNHRWEYDKGPVKFFEILQKLKDQGVTFKLIIAGTRGEKYPEIFDRAKEVFADHLIHFGPAQDREEYARLLHAANILPVTSQQDFFGMSVVEAIYCAVCPLLPDRLAYSEHVPEEFRHAHFYADENDLSRRLADLLQRGVPRRNYRDWVKHYDWSQQIADYDQALESLTSA